jgi:hypothetical protein
MSSLTFNEQTVAISMAFVFSLLCHAVLAAFLFGVFRNVEVSRPDCEACSLWWRWMWMKYGCDCKKRMRREIERMQLELQEKERAEEEEGLLINDRLPADREEP